LDVPLSTVATEVTAAAILADTTALIAKDFATETTLQKLRKWPYAAHNSIEGAFNPLTFVETFTYKDGVATVGTITIQYADALKNPPTTTTFSPAKAV
jgi:hypothetical protein